MISKSLLAAGAALFACAPAFAADFDAAKAFGARPAVEDASLSPDGTKLAFRAPAAAGQGATLFVVDTTDDAPPVRAFSVSGNPDRLSGCSWSSNERLVCTIWAVRADTHYRLNLNRMIAFNRDGSDLKLISKKESSDALSIIIGGDFVVDWLPDSSGSILMARNYAPEVSVGTLTKKDAEGLGVDLVDTRTGRSSKVEPANRLATEYISDGHGNIRIMATSPRTTATFQDSPVTNYSYRKKGSRTWLKLSDYDSTSKKGFVPYAVDPDRDVAYGLMKKDGRFAAYEMALDGSAAVKLVYERPDVDVDGFVQIGRRQRVVGVSYTTDSSYIEYSDPVIAKFKTALHKAVPGQPMISIVDSSVDENRLLIRAVSDKDPGTYYLFDKGTKQLRRLLAIRPELEGQKLADVKAITYKAADGTMVPAYLTLPPNSIGKNLPAIVMPHGGPAARDSSEFDWLVQFFAARGYVVIQPEFRGSTGYGDQWFQKNGFRSWKIAVGDVLDAGHYLVSSGIADPAKLGIFGWSYGGYAALQSVVVDPTLFKVAIAVAPVTDLAMLKNESLGWSNYRIMADYIGSGPHIAEGSPAQNAARIKVPVLMFHGTVDANVDVKESRYMDDRLTAAHVPHQLVIYDNLDHYLEDSAVRADMLSKADAFLRKAMNLPAN